MTQSLFHPRTGAAIPRCTLAAVLWLGAPACSTDNLDIAGGSDGSPDRRQDGGAGEPPGPEGDAGGDGPDDPEDGSVRARDASAEDGSTAPRDGGPDDDGPYQVFLGSTHAHTEFSFDAEDMGGGTPADAFAAAKAAGADFYITTDHVDILSGPTSHTPEQFGEAKQMAEDATDDAFVAIAGFEFHLDENEMNTFNLDLTEEIRELSWEVSPVEYLDYLTDFPEAISQWNHPGRKESEFNHFEGYTEKRNASVALLEVLNGDEEVYDTSYQSALDAGWHVGPSAGHDTHDDARLQVATRTGVLAGSLTREDILQGLRARRTFASQDPELKLWYFLNDTVMGSTIGPASAYQVSVRFEGGQGVENIEIVSNGGDVVGSGKPDGGQWSSAIDAKEGQFYYARLTGSDGAMSWTAPVWVESP